MGRFSTFKGKSSKDLRIKNLSPAVLHKTINLGLQSLQHRAAHILAMGWQRAWGGGERQEDQDTKSVGE